MVTLGYRAEIDSAQAFIEGIEQDEDIVLVFHGDADGCCAGAVMYRTLVHMGREAVFTAFLEKGENLYSDRLAKRVLARDPSRLIVLDMGSRGRPIIEGLSTMVIDHHRPEGIPPVEVFANSHDVDPPAPASLFTYQICRPFVPMDGIEWPAAVGTAADLGVDTDLEILRIARERYGKKVIQETASLINAARRAPDHDVPTAFDALLKANSPLDITEGLIPETSMLRAYREEVNAELRRAMRTAPKFSGRWAILAFSSPALVHPMVAVGWLRRLKNNIVISANYGYTEGNVHFSVRSALDVDLIEELRKIRPVTPESEYGHGHPRATGGILPRWDFEDFLGRVGFQAEEIAQISNRQDIGR